jgi:hypothetical protein
MTSPASSTRTLRDSITQTGEISRLALPLRTTLPQKSGALGRVLGDRKSVIRAGAGIVFDHNVTNALNFLQDQSNYLFQNSVTTRPNGDLATDPRFVNINTLPTLDPLPTVTRPFQPLCYSWIRRDRYG